MEMKGLRILGLSAMAAMMATACGQAPDSDTRATPATTQPSVRSVATPGPTSELERLRGEVVVGKDGYGITACGGASRQVIEFAPDARAFIDRFLEPGGHREFFLDGWAREREGGLVVESVERAHTEGPRCDAALENALFVARGNEPFWSLSLTAPGWVLQRPGEEPLHVTATMAKSGTDYAWGSAAPTARVEIVPGYCADGMADAASGWQAKLSLDGKVFNGCAHRGALPLP